MREILSDNLIRLAEALPCPLYVVGGKIRDYLSGYGNSDDTDICAPLDADTFARYAEGAGYVITSAYRNTGTLKLRRQDNPAEEYEYSCFRSDRYVRGVHRPEDSFFTDDILLDARRRDFKCNAVYYDIKAGEYVDPLGGLQDIKEKRMDTVVQARKVFSEDGLRLMRLARMAAQTGFTPSEECMKGAYENHKLIQDIAPERIWAELDKILHADEKHGIAGAQYTGMKILDDTRVLDMILPELTLGRGMEQRKDFHDHDVLEHTLRCVKYSAPDIRLAALLHDCGKPYCMLAYGKYYGHDKEGERIAQDICMRLKVSAKQTAETMRLVRWHMFNYRGDVRAVRMRRFVLENHDILDKMAEIMQADYSACKDKMDRAPAAQSLLVARAKMLADGAPMTLKELAIRGGDLLQAGFPPESIGSTLQHLLEDSALQGIPNTHDVLTERAIRVYLPKVTADAETSTGETNPGKNEPADPGTPGTK